MSTEETNVDALSSGDSALKEPAPPQDAADTTEENLNLEEEEKIPMTGAGGAGDGAGDGTGGPEEERPLDNGDTSGEKNGAVKLKMPEDEEEEEEREAAFTGLNKDELLRVAGTPRWVRIRWTLLILFWLGWFGMLAGSVLIILQAPRCRELPATNWWNDGPLYQIGNIQAFSNEQNLKGVEQKLDYLSQLKVRGLVIGPLHVALPNDPTSLIFEEVSPDVGTLQQFRSFLQAAHKLGISVVLDLTPNYLGSTGPWFSNISVTSVAERLKPALVFWLNEGVDGVQLDGVERVSTVVPSLWSDIRAIVQNETQEHPNKRVLIGVSERSSPEDVTSLLSSTGVDLLISKVLLSPDATARAQSIQQLYSDHNQSRLCWSLSGRSQGHLASLVGPALVKLHHLLLLTLPGTPFFNYGDEIGLMDTDTNFPSMLWDSDKDQNQTLQEEKAELSTRSFFRSLSDLRGKQRSLLIGDFVLLFNSSSSLAYMRVWDQNTRFVAALNWADEDVVLQLRDTMLPPQAAVVMSTNSSFLPAESTVDLNQLQLGPGQAALLSFPYTG